MEYKKELIEMIEKTEDHELIRFLFGIMEGYGEKDRGQD